ncbi:hypothetical protein AM1_E0160 (plasmid) [Acaryochloris marina MBIC11017]|uniref:Uncharacterized protein n=1 Tax=Acaryochloris marina (strain MBIC 11017) TaxID=329726 RepID=A8ZPJ3_ACAM1|nr:hypothetical protein AM1_E0160 [Acaryochloris marina MBIC11017]
MLAGFSVKAMPLIDSVLLGIVISSQLLRHLYNQVFHTVDLNIANVNQQPMDRSSQV